MVDFVDATSAVNSSRGANNNLYYANIFTTSVRDTTGAFRNNAGGAASAAIESNLLRRSGGTSIASGLDDLSDAFADLDDAGTAAGVAIVITDGQSARAPAVAAADALRGQGVTVVAVAVGGSLDRETLEAVASADSDGTPLVFAADEIGDIAQLLGEAVETVGARAAS